MNRFHRPAVLRICLAITLLAAPCERAADGAAASAEQSTGTIAGRVLNLTTREYVSSAEVRVQGTDRAAFTASDGSYRLSPVPAGPTVVTVTYTGMKTERATEIGRAHV